MEARKITVANAEAEQDAAKREVEKAKMKADSVTDDDEKQQAAQKVEEATKAQEKSSRNLDAAKTKLERTKKYLANPNVVPHTTILPGLQFWLAGLVGKPGTFYDVPAVRFTFELWSYL